MRVLVIGGTNFIGPPLVRRLVDLGHEVAVFHRGQTQADLPPGVRRLLGDRHRLGEHRDAFRRFDPQVVVDMIAFTERDALDLVATFRGQARRSVVISSADVYRAYGRCLGLEDSPGEPTPIPEDAPLRSVLFPYRRQAQGPDDFRFSYDKIPVERAILGAAELPGTVLRLPMIHGPGDPYRRLSPYLRRMDDGRPVIPIDEDLALWKCPRGYVEDVAAVITAAVVDDRATGQVFNVAEPVSFTEADWIRRIGEAAGWEGRVVTVPSGRLPVPIVTMQDMDTDTTKIRRELGYAEIVSPEESLARTIAWERSHPPGPALDYAAEDAILAELGG